MTTDAPERKGCPEHATPDARCVVCKVLGAAGERAAAADDGDPFLGRTVGNGYVVRRLIGQGGMGCVYEAEQTSLARRVAIKFLQSHLLRDELSTRRFYNEARAASRLNHPNSVAVFDFGATDDGVPFIVMEHLSGSDLAALLETHGALEPARVCRIARGVLGALAEAHALGVCHRDLKPENVIVVARHDGTEAVKVVDFGLARLALDSRLTDPNTVLGTPYYMAPEQFIGRELDGRADLYSLGVMMFELLTGRPLFDGEQPIALAHQHLTVPPPDPRSFAAVDDELALVVLRALAKKPSDRFESATAMAQAIERLSEAPAASKSDPARQRGRPVLDTLPTLDPVLGDLERATLRLAAAPVIVLGGRAGSGRTTTLGAFAERCRRAGLAVATARAEPCDDAASYAPLKTLVEELFQHCEANDAADLALDAFERAGYAELVSPVGLRGVTARSGELAARPSADALRSRAGAVGAAIAGVVRRAARRAKASRVALLLDDAAKYDALTLDALERALPRCGDVAIFVVVGEEDAMPGRFLQAPRLVVGARSGGLPIHGAMLRRLGRASHEAAPLTMAECVAALFDRADVRARAALQSMAVLGAGADAEALAALGCAEPDRSLAAATATGLVIRSDAGAELHRLVRELIAASIPAEVRRTLNDRALAWHTANGASVETRAHHAVWGGDAFGALLLLEQAGALARCRGDTAAAARWFGRGLERAREELAATSDETFESGVLTFTRKLADAVLAADRPDEARAILAEAVGLADPSSKEHARLALSRARIAARLGESDASRRFDALLASERAKLDPAFAAECAHGLAEACLAAGDARAAVTALEIAKRTEERPGADAEERAATALALAAAMEHAAASPMRIRAELERAIALSRRAAAPALEARALAMLARRSQAERQIREAIEMLARGVQLAEEAGDAETLDALRVQLGAARGDASARGSDSGAGRRVVLIVEDDAEMQEVLLGCLTEQGYVVHAASSGKQALRLLGTIERPIAILVDLMMPVMNGWDFVAALRDNRSYAGIPVTVLSAVADKAPEGVDCLSKPVQLGALLQVLAAAESRVNAATAPS